jgi:hypothetical protein
LHASKLSIDWRVEAPFAPFGWLRDPNDATLRWTPINDETFSEWSQRVITNTGGSSPFKPFASGEIQGPWLPNIGLHDSRYVRTEKTTIRAKLSGATGRCRWIIKGQEHGIETHCADEVRIENVPLSGSILVVNAVDQTVTISTHINIDHRIIVAFGDSYASGEGNPDCPTRWKKEKVRTKDFKWIDRNRASGALWLDEACHRSFFSNQTFVALKIASQSPHRLVTYLHYACSGAEILDGMMVKQKWPPGVYQRCKNDNTSFSDDRACYVPYSQLAAAVSDLCQGETYQIGEPGSEFDNYARSVIDRYKHKLWKAKNYHNLGLDLLKCKGKGNLRKPDLILLSIGGNDAGFASLAGWAIAPSKWKSDIAAALVKGRLVCPDIAEKSGCSKPYDIDLIRQLGRRFNLLGRAMREVLPIDQTTVVQSTYPNPLLKADGTYCGDSGGHNPDNPWASAVFLVGKFWAKNWEFNVRPDESRILSEYTIPKLREAIISGIAKNGFEKADLNDLFIGHGWCDPNHNDPPLSLPSHTNNEDAPKWRCGSPPIPKNPSCWDGYSEMNRFIRTMNDSYLTQSSERKDGHTGTMHPNVGGHASIAEEIYKTVQQVLPWLHEKTDE